MPHPPRPASVRVVAKVTAFVLLVVLASTTAACTGDSDGAAPRATVPTSSGDGVERTSVDTRGAGEATVTAAELTRRQRAGLDEWGGLTVSVGDPVEITMAEPLPDEGIVLERTYREPLPADAGATFAFYDPELGAWHAVPSHLSADRKTLRATVHHLSLWSDFVGWVSGAITDAADWTAYQIGKIFDTRVDPPHCDGPEPEWVASATSIATARTNPVLFCTGHDAKHPDLLVVKARVNRGYGYTAEVHVPTTWSYNSTFDNQLDIDDLLRVVGHPGEAAFQLLQQLSAGDGILVGPGHELSFGVDEPSLWSTDDPTVLRMRTPEPASYLVWLLAQLLVTDLELKSDGLVAAVIGVAGCAADLRSIDGPQGAIRALTTCLTAIDEDLARHLATALDEHGVKDAGKLAGRIVGKISVYLALLGPVFGSMTYFGDTKLDDGARTVSVTGSHPPRVGRAVLRSAQVPEACGLPAQRLVDGRTTKGSPGEGWLEDKSAQVDLAGLGYRQALTTYGCTAGGVSWPETLILVGEGGELLAHYYLADLGKHEHADVTSYRVDGDRVIVTWKAYEGAGFYMTTHRSEVTYDDGRLVVDDQLVSYDDGPGFAEAVADAAAAGDKDLLLDPAAVPDDYWDLLVRSIAGRDPGVLCDPSGTSFDCGVGFAPAFDDELYFFVGRHHGSWRVEYASTSID